MANSNHRITEDNTIHHLTSRIAHKVRFLQEGERNDLLEMIRRTAEFAGVRLLGWCLMTNHFHILAYLPVRTEISEAEVLRRYAILKGADAAEAAAMQLSVWREQGEGGVDKAQRWLDGQRKRMGSIGEFMKIVKQWFTVEYNRRNGHQGTLWESSYHDKLIPHDIKALRQCLVYIHLNPIRAALCSRFDEYAWSSFTAFRRGDETAAQGLKFIYGDNAEDLHVQQLDAALEYEKRRCAEEIARKRLEGYAVPEDPLTTEAMNAQALAKMREVRAALDSLRMQRESEARLGKRRARLEEEIAQLRILRPEIGLGEMSEILGIPAKTLYRRLAKMRK